MEYSELPADVVEKIVTEHLETHSEAVAFAGVCKSWRSTAVELPVLRHLLPCFPGLLISKATISSASRPDDDDHYCRHLHEFLPLTTALADPPRTTTIRSRLLPRLSLPHFPSRSQRSDIVRKMRSGIGFNPRSGVGCDVRPHLGHKIQENHHVGSKDGWLVVVQPAAGEKFPPRNFYLVNPITGATIPLPPIPYTPALISDTSENVKALLTSSPDDADNSCHVIILFRTCLAWCNVFSSPAQGERRWQFRIDVCPKDAAYFGGKLYAITESCILYKRIKSGSSETQPGKEEIVIPFSPTMPGGIMSRHLSHFHDGTEDQLLLVLRCYVGRGKLCVYKLVIKGDGNLNGSHNWEEVRSLDGYALFLSSHQSFSLPVANNGSGIKGNCIYFAFFNRWGRHENDCGIFNLETEKMTRFEHPTINERKIRSFWFLPTPWDIPKLAKDPERVAQLPKNKNRGPGYHHYHGMIKVTTNPCLNRFQALSLLDANSDYEEEDEDDDEDDIEASSLGNQMHH